METIYYNLDARRVTLYDMASGEAAPRSYTCLCPKGDASAAPGEVLDLDAYRRNRSGESGPGGPADLEDAPRKRARRRAPALLEVCASLAVIAMAWVVIAQFLRFL